MKINPILPIKRLTVVGCCDKVLITSGKQRISFGRHSYIATVVHCSNCGSKKATSNIQHIKENQNAES